VPAEVDKEEGESERRLFVLQIVQPGLAGLTDGSVSTLAPLFAAAYSSPPPSRKPDFADPMPASARQLPQPQCQAC